MDFNFSVRVKVRTKPRNESEKQRFCEKNRTLRDMSEVDSRRRESFLIRSRQLQHVSEGGDRDWSFDPVDSNGGCDGLRHSEDVSATGQVAVLEVPPHRNLNSPRLFLVVVSTPRSELR